MANEDVRTLHEVLRSKDLVSSTVADRAVAQLLIRVAEVQGDNTSLTLLCQHLKLLELKARDMIVELEERQTSGQD